MSFHEVDPKGGCRGGNRKSFRSTLGGILGLTESGFELAKSGWELLPFHEVDPEGGSGGEDRESLITFFLASWDFMLLAQARCTFLQKVWFFIQ